MKFDQLQQGKKQVERGGRNLERETDRENPESGGERVFLFMVELKLSPCSLSTCSIWKTKPSPSFFLSLLCWSTMALLQEQQG